MLKIHRASDPIEITQLKAMFYGQPGSGKSSLAFTTEAPLMLDFDGGAHRSAFRQDAVRVHSWDEVAAISGDDLKGYKTLIVDTVGRALDFLATSLIANDPKLARKTGDLTLQGYGALKSSFAQWIGRINTLGLDVVMIAHDKESTNERDIKIVRPDIVGGTYHEVFKLADAVGYLYLEGKKRVLDFNPTENYVGKNPAQFELLTLPEFTLEPQYGASLLAEIKTTLGAISAEGQKIVAALSEYREKLAAIESTEAMTELLAEVNAIEDPLKAQVKSVMNERVKELGFEYDKKAKSFVAPESEPEEKVA